MRIDLTKAAIAYPGIYLEELPSGVRPIEGVSTSTAGFVGLSMRNTAGANAVLVTSWREFEKIFVKCDRTTMTPEDIENGRLIVLIGIAPIRPAEFVIFRIVHAAAA